MIQVGRHDDERDAVVLTIDSGFVLIQYEESVASLRHFWGELGRKLDDIETEAKRKAEEAAAAQALVEAEAVAEAVTEVAVAEAAAEAQPRRRIGRRRK